MSSVHAATPKKIVLQLTDATPEKHALVLNVADNLMANYGRDAEIEIVAFGPGLRLLLADSKHSERVNRLAAKGVRFSACRNTYAKMSKMTGQESPLSEQAAEVKGGAARIIELVEQGYILIRP
ncbi:MAG: DsrE family protein [Pseudomonadota bacterium]|nr:MAG: DsrE family protein [Pseudomonadota bacterium]